MVTKCINKKIADRIAKGGALAKGKNGFRDLVSDFWSCILASNGLLLVLREPDQGGGDLSDFLRVKFRKHVMKAKPNHYSKLNGCRHGGLYNVVRDFSEQEPWQQQQQF